MAISKEILQTLANIVGEEDCKYHDFELAAYSNSMIYGTPTRPDVLLLPETEEEISSIMKLATAEVIPVVVRAGGTAGPISMSDGGIMLDLAKMNKIISIDPKAKMVTLQAGVRLYDMVQELRKVGHDMPLKFWGGNGTTIGGYVNGPSLVGTRVARYGTLHYWLFGLRVVLPTGEIVATGTNAYENQTKPSMGDPWMCPNSLGKVWLQSLGTLGVVTEATLLMIPVPEASKHLAYGFKTIEDLRDAASDIQLANAATDIEHEDKGIYEILNKPLPEGMEMCLVITNEGYPEEVECKAKIAEDIMKKYGGTELDVSYAHLTYDNTANFNFSTAKDGMFCCAAACADPDSYPDAYRAIKETWDKYNIKNGWSCWTCYPNWNQGWTIGSYDYDTQFDDYQMAMFEINKKGLLIPNSFPYTFHESYEEYIQRMKDCLDPAGIMNPNGWFMVSGAQYRLVDAIELLDEDE